LCFIFCFLGVEPHARLSHCNFLEDKNKKKQKKMPGQLGSSRARNMSSLKNTLKHTQTVTSTQANILASTEKMSAPQVTRIERALRKESELIIKMTSKVGALSKLLKREDGAHAQAQQEMRTSRRSVSTFMNDTLRIVNDIAFDVAVARPNVTDNLVENPSVLGDDPYVVSSFFHLHTRPRDTAAAGIFQRRRGSSARRAAAATPAITSSSAPPRAIKASDASTPRNT
jgi:hypothetical protein